jgi:CheY-like chemotaxis protein
MLHEIEPDRPSDAAGRTGRVCVVDDDPDIRQCLRFLLEDEGYDAEEADNGEAALGLLHSDPRPRVLLLDRMMPCLDGIQTLRRLMSGPAEVWQRTITLFMTARHDPPEPESMSLIHRSTFATVIKPFDLDRVLATVARASEHLAGVAG